MPEHQPRRGDLVEAWIKKQRDMYPPTDEEWTGLDNLLDEYREAADTGQVWREYGTTVLGTSPLRTEAREAGRMVRHRTTSFSDQYQLAREAADAASDVWEPVVERLVGVIADAYADVDGWKQKASDVVLDTALNPVVAVYDTEKHEFVEDERG